MKTSILIISTLVLIGSVSSSSSKEVLQTGEGKVREYKILLGVISVFVGLASFYVLAVSSYGILKGLVFGLIVSLLYPILSNELPC